MKSASHTGLEHEQNLGRLRLLLAYFVIICYFSVKNAADCADATCPGQCVLRFSSSSRSNLVCLEPVTKAEYDQVEETVKKKKKKEEEKTELNKLDFFSSCPSPTPPCHSLFFVCRNDLQMALIACQ